MENNIILIFYNYLIQVVIINTKIKLFFKHIVNQKEQNMMLFFYLILIHIQIMFLKIIILIILNMLL